MMMLVGALALVAGLLVGIRLLASLYGVIDLWYKIGTAWAAVLGRIALWAAVTGGALLLLGGMPRWAFLAGMCLHATQHVVTSVALAWAGVRKTRATPTVE